MGYSCFLPQCQMGRYPHPQIFNNCYSNASSRAELGWQPRTRGAGGQEAPFVVPEGMHRSTGVIWALSRCCCAQQLTPTPSRALSLRSSRHRALLLRNNNHWTMRTLQHAEALFHSQQGQPGLSQAHSLGELDPVPASCTESFLRNTDN